MRVLLINYEYPPVGGGAANATREIARALVTLGHHVTVLTARYKRRQPSDRDPGINLIEVPAIRRRKDRCSVFEMATFVAGAARKINAVLRTEKIEGSIAFFSIPSGPVAWWGWRRSKVPYLVALRGGDVPGNETSIKILHSLVRPLRHAVFRNAGAIFANSQKLKEMSQRADPFSVSVIPNGVDIEFWRPRQDRPIPPPWKLLHVGRFQEQKNLRWLISELAASVQNTKAPPWELHLVGDGPLRKELEAQVRSSRLVERVHWHGWLNRESLRTVYQQSHVLIHPARYEGMPNTILEAASCGLAIILSEEAASPELIAMIPDALIYNSSSPDSFASALEKHFRNEACAKASAQHNIPRWTEVAAATANLFHPTPGID